MESACSDTAIGICIPANFAPYGQRKHRLALEKEKEMDQGPWAIWQATCSQEGRTTKERR
jgi:hypothetical protein